MKHDIPVRDSAGTADRARVRTLPSGLPLVLCDCRDEAEQRMSTDGAAARLADPDHAAHGRREDEMAVAAGATGAAAAGRELDRAGVVRGGGLWFASSIARHRYQLATVR